MICWHTKIAFEPGSEWRYSNTGFLVLGKIIELVSKQNYFDYIRDHIYNLAGMTSTDSYELDKVNPNLAVGYSKEFTNDSYIFENNIFKHILRGGPAGGGYSTVKDLLKFDQALRNNRLLTSKLKAELFATRPELNSPNYGYGFEVATKNHNVGHTGGFAGIDADLTMYQQSGFTTIILSNYDIRSRLVDAKIKYLIQCLTYES